MIQVAFLVLFCVALVVPVVLVLVFHFEKSSSSPSVDTAEADEEEDRVCCLAMTASCLACAAGQTPVEYCNDPTRTPQAADCDQYFDCNTKERFNSVKEAFCA